MSAVLGIIANIDSTLALLDSIADEDAITKLTIIKNILGSGFFGKRQKRSDESRIKYFHNQLV